MQQKSSCTQLKNEGIPENYPYYMEQISDPEADKNQHEVSGNNWEKIRHY